MTVASALTAAAKAISAARTQLGKPYKFGAEAPGVDFDCSGLTQWAYRQAGITIPRVAAQQQAATQRITRAELSPGDLVFYGNPAHHVAIYLGAGKIIQAPHTGAVIDIVNMGNPTNFGRVTGSGAATTPAAQTGSNLGGGGGGPATAQEVFNPFSGPAHFLGGIWHDVTGVPSTIGDVAQSIEHLAKNISTVVTWLTWLFNPAHWLRIGAAIGGLIILLGALFFLAKAMGISAPSASNGGNMPPVMPIPV